MTEPQAPDQQSPLSAELRWFVALRWLAGLTVILGTATNALWVGWSGLHGRALGVGGVILAYNVALFAVLHGRAPRRRGVLIALAWCQILVDLGCLTLLTLWTGGVSSPLLGLFVLHMVFASLLLPPLTSYLGASVAMVMLFGGLWLSDQWPGERASLLIALGWVLTLLLTVFVANHITGVLRAHERALRGQHRRMRAIVETAADGIITFNEEGTIESVNPAIVRIFGHKASELVNTNVNRLAALPRYQPDEGPAWRELTGRCRDGTTVPLEVAVSEVQLGEQRIFTAIVRDITEHKRSEATLQALNEELKRQQQALVQHEKMAAMGQMAAGVAHEISNPLANMDSVLQLIERRPDRLGPDTLETLREQVGRIHRIVRQMTYFAHPDEACWETLSINEVVDSALAMVRFDRRLRSVELVLDLSPSAGEVTIMPHAIQQVLVNLVLNALDAAADAVQPHVIVSTRREESWCVIEVSDNGRGIAPDHLSRIFEPFFTTKPLGQGTGLGLPISHSLVQRHDGQCDVQSTVGQGTRFSVRLPVAGPASCRREEPEGDIPDSENLNN